VLGTLSAAFNADVEDLLAAAVAISVAEWKRSAGTVHQRALLLDAERSGRSEDFESSDISHTIGRFTVTYPVRLNLIPHNWAEVLAGGSVVGARIKQVKEELRAVPRGGIGYELLRYVNPDSAAELGQHAEPEIGFRYVDHTSVFADLAEDGWQESAELDCVAENAIGSPLAHALEITAIACAAAKSRQLRVVFSWNHVAFTDAEMNDLADKMLQTLQGFAAYGERPDAGGITPSDVFFSDLIQGEIDEFEDELAAEEGSK
jgi:non-ribosomal peptide synthase protein (TIGR01720 family)